MLRFDRSLLTTPYLLILAPTFVGFMAEYILRPVIPLLIIDRGGGATLIGLITGVFALPSIALRPMVGRLLDTWPQGRILRIGTLLGSLWPAGLLLHGILPLIPTRFIQGTAWALFTVSTRTIMAQAAPAGRRGEASAYFAAMPALALLVAPGVGVALYIATGAIGPVLVASTLAMATFVIVLRLPTGMKPPVPGSIAGTRNRVAGWFVEPSAFPAMAMTGAFMAADTLFTVFVPVFIATVGEGIAALALYYPAYGLVSAASLFAVGRISDRLARGTAVRVGAVLAVTGLIVAIFGNSLLVFGLGAAIYAIGASFASTALSALSIDKAPPDRLGSAMATYSIGYQLAIGASAVLWGPLITTAGFDIALGGALLLVVISAAASYRYARG